MSAMYDLVEKPNPKGDGEKQQLYPRIVSSGTISTEKLIERISGACSLTPGDLKGAIVELTHAISEYLKDGFTVELGELGYFSPRIKGRGVNNKKEIRSTSIYFDNVNFRASKKIRQSLYAPLERAQYGFQKSSNSSREKRRAQLETFLDKNAFITRSEYTQLTGLLKNKALEELRALEAEGTLCTRGRGSHIVFMRVENR
ncbi:HU family DNA-binding protein [uncultured Bacteroides sp.]|uniref:HU family DNA-binding protein n=1 Tax=uncultured Bacteroides sp. TaxID=162156 RepID=UPI002AA6AAA9|nr:HU family DNA-binding protein [uncultured Bacteroides sp.]